MKETDVCPLCESGNIKKIKTFVFRFPGEDVESHLFDITYVRLWILFERILMIRDSSAFSAMICQNCGLIFTNPRFSLDDLRIKYETINELGSVKYRLKQDPPFNLNSRARRIYDLISQHFYSGRKNKPKILDYGGASAYNLIPFANSFECSLLDYEKWDLPSEVDYLGKDVSDLDETDQFHVILLLHTLEHLSEPKTFINDLCKHLEDEGIIYVEVPLGCFREWQFLREPLTHVNFFSEESLMNLLTSCGLNVIHLSTSYQWITHAKTWCINIIGTKQKNLNEAARILTTKEQMNKIVYYLPYLTKGRAIMKALRSLTGL